MKEERPAVVVVSAALDGRDPAPQGLAPVRLPLVALQQVEVVHESDAVPENGASHLLHVVLGHGQEGGARDVVLTEGLCHELHVHGDEVLIDHLVDCPL